MAETIAIFGATGGSGSEILAEALDQGYLVRIMVRTPSKLPEEIKCHPNLTLLEGDIASLDTVRETVGGAKYVINAVGGPVGKPRDFPTGTFAAFLRDLVGVLRETPSVQVYLHQAGCLSVHPDGTMPLAMRIADRVLGRWILGIGPNNDEHSVEMRYLESVRGDVPFKIICTRPGGLKKGAGGTELVASEVPTGLALGMVDFKDLAVFTVKALKDESLYGKYPYVVKA